MAERKIKEEYTGDTVDLAKYVPVIEAKKNEAAREADTAHTLRGKLERVVVKAAYKLEDRLDRFMRRRGF